MHPPSAASEVTNMSLYIHQLGFKGSDKDSPEPMILYYGARHMLPLHDRCCCCFFPVVFVDVASCWGFVHRLQSGCRRCFAIVPPGREMTATTPPGPLYLSASERSVFVSLFISDNLYQLLVFLSFLSLFYFYRPLSLN